MYKKNIGSGDDGKTDFYGVRIAKTDDNLILLGFIDEVNAILGLIVAKHQIEILKKIEKLNLDIMGFVAGYIGGEKVKKCIKFIESEIKNLSDINIDKFIVFDKDEKTSLLNILRTKIRIAEIYAWKVGKKDVAIYLNRLSDLIFLVAVRDFLR